MIKKWITIVFLILISLPLHSEPFTLIFEKEINSDFWKERNLNPDCSCILYTPIIINESEIGMIIRITNFIQINKVNNLVQKEIPEPEYIIEKNYVFEILNISNNTFIHYDLPFLTKAENITELNYSKIKNELYIEQSEGYNNYKKISYNFNSKELSIYESFNSNNLSFSERKPLKISKNQMLAVLIDKECENYAYDNYYEEYIGKVILYNSNDIKKARNFENEKIIQFLKNSQGNNILVSNVDNPIYNPEFNLLLIRSDHSLNEKKSTTIYLFKKS